MKYQYYTVTGIHEIEVDEQMHDVLHAMDREDYNSDRKYRRHNPVSLSNADYDGDWMADEADILGDFIKAEDWEKLRAALEKLTHEQRSLIEDVYTKNGRIVDIARREGVSHVAVLDRIKRIHEKLKNFL